jgi:hypothetical protein
VALVQLEDVVQALRIVLQKEPAFLILRNKRTLAHKHANLAPRNFSNNIL